MQTKNVRLKTATVELLNKNRGPLTQDFFIAALIKKFIEAGHSVGDLLKEEKND